MMLAVIHVKKSKIHSVFYAVSIRYLQTSDSEEELESSVLFLLSGNQTQKRRCVTHTPLTDKG